MPTTAFSSLLDRAESSKVPSPPDSHLDFTPKRRVSMRRSALAMTADLARKEEEAAEGRKRCEPLRQSALPANCQRAQAITTMENADVDAMIIGLAAIVRTYTRDNAPAVTSSSSKSSSKKRVEKKTLPPEERYFDEETYPLDGSGAFRRAPTAKEVEKFVMEIVIALELDESSVVIGLILLERAMTTRAEAPLHLTPQTWRPALLMAIVVASKVVYDEKVFLQDYREQLPQYCLEHATQQEMGFLTLLGYNTTVRRGQYAKYYYCLEDVARAEAHASVQEEATAPASPPSKVRG